MKIFSYDGIVVLTGDKNSLAPECVSWIDPIKCCSTNSISY